MSSFRPSRSWPALRLIRILFSVAMIFAWTSRAAETAKEGRQLTVTVLEANGGKPIAGAEVTVPALSWTQIPRPTNEWKLLTDQRGIVTVRLPTNDFQQFVLYVRHTNYAQRGATWFNQSGSVMGSVPESFTFRLDAGATVGGFVRDERGNAISGANVLLTGNRNLNYSGQRTHQEFPMHGGAFGVAEGLRIPTDTKGFWQAHHVSTDLDTLQVDVERPTGARTVFSTLSPGAQGISARAEKIAIEDLRATNAILTLKDGITIRGIVVDGSGQPVGNARIKERSGRIAQNSTYIFTNGADGRFELKHRRAPQLVYLAEAPGFAISTASILTGQTGEVRIVMAPLVPLRLRIIGEQGEPVPSAFAEVIPWKPQNESLEWKGQTDANGRVIWTNAPGQEIALYVRSTNYPIRIARVRPGSEELVVRLRKDSDKSVNVELKVVDATSGAPLEKFEVWRDLQGYRPFVKAGDGARGIFTNEVARTIFERGTVTTFRFQVRAEGYSLWTSEQLQFEEGDQTLSVKLERGGAPEGIVLQPDGKPASGATVYLKSRNQGSLFANTQGPQFYAGQGAETVTTESDGSFKFSAAEDDYAVVMVHLSGFASMTVGELKRSPKVQLHPYATLSGVVTMNGEPRKGERLHLKAPINWSGRRNYLLVFNASSDDEGKFTFTNLPPGDYVLARTPHTISGTTTMESHRWPMDLKPGEHKTIEYTFNGRSVIGHVEATANVDWKNDAHILAAKVPPGPEPPNYYDFADVKAFEAARDAFGNLPAVIEHERKQQQFQLLFDTEGNFRVDDVPPGTYELRLRATKPPANRNGPRMGREEEIGSLVREIVIPPGKDDFDLGTLEMQAKGETISRVPLEFRAVAVADDKPFDIASLRGKPVVLTFWGNWAPHSLEFLAVLKGVQEEVKDAVAVVTVNLDDDKDIVNAHLNGLPQNWTHTTIRGRDRVDVAERLEVNTLPLTLVLDATGRIVTRDVQEKRLSTALKRLTAKTGK